MDSTCVIKIGTCYLTYEQHSTRFKTEKIMQENRKLSLSYMMSRDQLYT